MAKKKTRPWFDVVKGLAVYLGIQLGTTAYVVAWVRYLWCMLTNRDYPPQWLFAVGSGFVWIINALRFVRCWVDVQWLKVRLRVSAKHLQEWEQYTMTREDFMDRCIFWSQMAQAVMMTDQFPAIGCDRLGSAAGRLVRYARTSDPSVAHDREMVMDIISQIEREFVKLPKANQQAAIHFMKAGAKMAGGVRGQQYLAVVEQEENRLQKKQELSN